MLLLRLQPSAYADDLTDLKEDEEGENDAEPTAAADDAAQGWQLSASKFNIASTL